MSYDNETNLTAFRLEPDSQPMVANLQSSSIRYYLANPEMFKVGSTLFVPVYRLEATTQIVQKPVKPRVGLTWVNSTGLTRVVVQVNNEYYTVWCACVDGSIESWVYGIANTDWDGWPTESVSVNSDQPKWRLIFDQNSVDSPNVIK